ncbi:phosphoadenosine phosphosulfate reductase family protein [Oceanimonas pelagia]|uniref:Phosphoadenosine phosphosulfate reductase family protein n=1 Tax=Oceanimonas pelagia TaxID=3028314 RepID=A0AA50QB64_9GAMM|nr:phosphoadenosine phosphosulfate reductase family protein [Oceanimonas pelagia]WMC11738.1 phosphoadenosine phosphosulfate reductase family protein [Oceanimonas pelagia]
MTHVVSFSGGRTSAYLVHLMEQKRRDEGWDVHYVFMDTGAEHPLTYRFVREVVKFWDIPLTVLRVKINPQLGQGNGYEVFSPADIQTHRMPALTPFMDVVRKYGTPYIGGEFCTDRMKLQPFKKWCDDTFGKGNYTTWIGIRADEPRRLKERVGIRYLAELSDFDKQDVLDWWKDQPFDLLIPGHLGNCIFCIKKSTQKVGLATLDEPGAMRVFNHDVINSKETRDGHRATPKQVMYRGHLSLEGIAKMHSDMEYQRLYADMLAAKRYDTGSCSESCEIFNGEPQYELEFA